MEHGAWLLELLAKRRGSRLSHEKQRIQRIDGLSQLTVLYSYAVAAHFATGSRAHRTAGPKMPTVSPILAPSHELQPSCAPMELFYNRLL